MQVLCLAEHKLLAMDKLNYYVMQTNQMLPKYISDAEEHAGTLLTDSTLRTMDSQTSPAGLSDDEEDASENNGVENINEDSDGDAELVNSDGDSDNEPQVLMLSSLYFFLIQPSNLFHLLLLIHSYRSNNDLSSVTGLAATVMQFWNKHKSNLLHNYSLVGYILSPNPTIMEDAITNKSLEHNEAAKQLITKLLLDPGLVGNNRNIVWRFC